MDATPSNVPASSIARASTCRRAVAPSSGRVVRSVGPNATRSVGSGRVGSGRAGRSVGWVTTGRSIGSIDRVDRSGRSGSCSIVRVVIDRSGSCSIDRVVIDRSRRDRSGRARSIGSIGSSSIDRVDRVGSGRARSRRSIDRVGPSIGANLREGLDDESRPDGTPRAGRVLSRNVAWVIPFGSVRIRSHADGRTDG